jgi:hypothetical protein
MHLRSNTVKMEAMTTSETSIIRNPTWRHNSSHTSIKSAINSSYYFVAYLSTSAQNATSLVNKEMGQDKKEEAVIQLW